VRQLTKEEREARARALLGAFKEEERRVLESDEDFVDEVYDEAAEGVAYEEAVDLAPEPVDLPTDPESLRQREIEELKRIQAHEQAQAAEAERKRQEEEAKKRPADDGKRATDDKKAVPARPGAPAAPAADAALKPAVPGVRPPTTDDEEDERRNRKAGGAKAAAPKVAAPTRKAGDRRRSGKLTVSQALNTDDAERTRSLAAVRRARERERLRQNARQEVQKVTREVVLPEVITVQ